MRFKMVGNKRDTAAVVVRNAESSATIPAGSPVCLNLSGTDDGLGVILPSGSAAKAHAGAFGVMLAAVTASAYGEAQVFGFCNAAIYLIGTRAASSDSWTSTASVALGVMLNIDTINNAFTSSGGTLAKTSFLPMAVLAATVGSVAASATATSDTRTALTTSASVFLRML